MKSNKRLYTFFQKSKATNDDILKEFNAYIKVIKSYRGKTPLHPDLLKANLTNIEVSDADKPTPYEKKNAQEEVK